MVFGTVLGFCGYEGLETAAAWRGDWFDTGQTLQAGLDMVLLVTVPFAARQGGMEARARTEWTGDCSARGPLARALLSVSPSVLWPLATFGVMASATSAMTWPAATAGQPPVFGVVHGMALLTGAACLAHVVGGLCPLRVLPLLAVLVLLLPALLGFGLEGQDVRHYTGPPIPQHLPMGAVSTAAWWRPWAGVAALVFAVVGGLALQPRRPLVAMFLLLTVLACTDLGHLNGSDRTPDLVAPIAVHCSNGSPKACLSDDRKAYRSELTDAVDHFSHRLAGVRGAPSHYLKAVHTGDPLPEIPKAATP
ncbi:hypothetical protein [Streptomyces sp. NBC_00019]|uniref:hypothetical protein n=1 Tax=Streptomyces sp. NBC_00019 TaxID=2975623 RepID=UPI003246D9BC